MKALEQSIYNHRKHEYAGIGLICLYVICDHQVNFEFNHRRGILTFINSVGDCQIPTLIFSLSDVDFRTNLITKRKELNLNPGETAGDLLAKRYDCVSLKPGYKKTLNSETYEPPIPATWYQTYPDDIKDSKYWNIISYIVGSYDCGQHIPNLFNTPSSIWRILGNYLNFDLYLNAMRLPFNGSINYATNGRVISSDTIGLYTLHHGCGGPSPVYGEGCMGGFLSIINFNIDLFKLDHGL